MSTKPKRKVKIATKRQKYTDLETLQQRTEYDLKLFGNNPTLIKVKSMCISWLTEWHRKCKPCSSVRSSVCTHVTNFHGMRLTIKFRLRVSLGFASYTAHNLCTLKSSKFSIIDVSVLWLIFVFFKWYETYKPCLLPKYTDEDRIWIV